MEEKRAKICTTCGRTYEKDSDFLSSTSRWRVCKSGHLWFNCSCDSTMLIKKGKFDWFTPDMTMSQRARSVFNQLSGLKALPHIPTSIMLLQQLISKENTTAKQLAEATKKEPLIAAHILDMANNLKVSDGTHIESLEHAISYVGIKTLNELVLAASIRSFPFKSKVFKADDFWQTAILTGKIAETLARKYNRAIKPDEAYLAGTLCNIGKVVDAICFPDVADKITQDISDVDVLGTWIEGEKKYQAQDHRVLGEIAATLWGLPEFIITASQTHHSKPKGAPDDPVNLSEIVSLANQLAHWILLQPTHMNEALCEMLFSRFAISPTEVDALIEELIKLKH